jgi:hypothetical protein
MYKNNITEKGFKYYPGKIFVYEGLDVKENHGTVLTSICFVSYKYPLLKSKNKTKKKKNV